MTTFVELDETTHAQITRKVWVNPYDVCLVTESLDSFTEPTIHTTVFLRNGEYINLEDYPHTVMNKLGITI